jgi:hypothetical protein
MRLTRNLATHTTTGDPVFTYTHLSANPTVRPRLAAIPDTLEAIQATLGGSYEPIPVDALNYIAGADVDDELDCFHLLIDADGKAKNLPVNDLATRLGRLFEGDAIVGDALLVHTDRWADTVALPNEHWNSVLQHVQSLDAWSRAQTWPQMLQTMVEFLEGRLVLTPEHGGPLDRESVAIKDDLVHFAQHGLMPTNSQPWMRNARSQQRSCLDLLVLDERYPRALIQALAATSLICLVATPGRSTWQDIPITMTDGEAGTFAGRLQLETERSRWCECLHPAAEPVVSELTQVQIIDPRWDSDRGLWDGLRTAISELGLPRLV